MTDAPGGSGKAASSRQGQYKNRDQHTMDNIRNKGHTMTVELRKKQRDDVLNKRRQVVNSTDGNDDMPVVDGVCSFYALSVS